MISIFIIIITNQYSFPSHSYYSCVFMTQAESIHSVMFRAGRYQWQMQSGVFAEAVC